MTNQKKIMLGALAAIGGILIYARAKKKRDLTNSGVENLTKSFMANVKGSTLVEDGGQLKVNIFSTWFRCIVFFYKEKRRYNYRNRNNYSRFRQW